MTRRMNSNWSRRKGGHAFTMIVVLGLVLAAFWSHQTVNVTASSNPQLVSATNIPLGFQPSQAVLADVNGDGKLDLVTMSGTSIEVFLGNGSGTFNLTPIVTSTNAVSSGPFAVADVTGDGHADIVIDDPEGGALHVLFGKGDGTFVTPGTTYTDILAFYGNAMPVYIVDMNGDGRPDIVVPAVFNNSVTVLLNDSGLEGAFENPQTITVASGSQEVVQLAIGNLMGTGNNDLAVGVTGGSVRNSVIILPNTTPAGAHTLTFGPAQTIQLTQPSNTTAETMSGLVAANFGNGNVDLMAAEPNSAGTTAGTLYFVEGNGNGTFGQEQLLGNQSIPFNGNLITADFNNDGKADLAFGNGNDGFTVLLSQGVSNSKLSFTSVGTNYVAGQYAGAPAAGDVNGDGYADLVVPVSDGVSVFLNNQNGTFQGSRSYPAAGTSPQGVIALKNFFGGSEPDVAFITPNTKSVTVLGTLNPPSGTLPLQFQGPANPFAPTALAGGCLKTTGACTAFVAVAVPTAAANGNAVLQILENGVPASTVPLPDGIGVTAMAVGDFNGDGNTDLALVLSNSFDSVEVLTGNGSGSFGNGQTFPVGQNPVAIAAADFNADGLTDLAVVNQNDNPPDVGVLINDTVAGGEVSFHSMVPYAASTSHSGSTPFPTALTVGNFDNVNGPDIALVLGSEEINVFLNNGNGAFTAKAPQSVYGATGPIATSDFNGDGNLDLVITNPVPLVGSCGVDDAAIVLLGNGDGTFEAGNFACSGSVATGFLYPAGNGPNSVALADFDGDGKPDIAVADGTGNMVTLILSENLGATAGPSFASYTGTPPLGASGANPIVNLSTNVGSGVSQQVFVTNTGGSAFSLTGMTLNPAGPPWVVNSVECNGTPETFASFTAVSLGPAESCEVTLEFEPTEPGAGQNATLTVENNAAGSNAATVAGGQSISLSGTATAPYASFSGSQVGWGTVQQGSAETQTLTITNTGNGPLNFNNVSIGGSSAFTLFSNGCAGIFNPGQSCQSTFQFDPPVTATGFQALSATVTFTDNAAPGESGLPSTSDASAPGFWQQQVSLVGNSVGCIATTNSVAVNGLATTGIEPNPRAPGHYAQTITLFNPLGGNLPPEIFVMFEGLNANGAYISGPGSISPAGSIGNPATCPGDVPFSQWIILAAPIGSGGFGPQTTFTVDFTAPPKVLPHYSYRFGAIPQASSPGGGGGAVN